MAVSDITNGRMRFVNTPALTSGQSGREKDRFLLFYDFLPDYFCSVTGI